MVITKWGERGVVLERDSNTYYFGSSVILWNIIQFLSDNMLANASDDSRKEGCSTSSGDDPSMSFTHLGEQIGWGYSQISSWFVSKLTFIKSFWLNSTIQVKYNA